MDSDHDEGPPSPPIQIDYRDPAPRLKPISFVAATSSSSLLPNTKPKAIGDSYLSLVLAPASPSPIAQEDTVTRPQSAPPTINQPATQCEICHLPLSSTDMKRHTTSVAHQVCLQHTHVPSSIDRSRKGLQYLQAYGFDPDARTGLGAGKSGIQHPIKLKEKIGKEGIGMTPKAAKKEKEKVKKLGPKEIKKLEGQQKKRNERLQRMFYTNGDLEKYLGPDA
jgi:hypothetical protein